MFALDTPTRLKLNKASPRKEHHGDELVQAIDLDVTWQTTNLSLVMLDPWLIDCLYHRNAATEAQASIDGVDITLPNLRLVDLHMPLKWDHELAGRNFRVNYGSGGRSDLILSTCNVKKFKITALEGGTVEIAFQVQCDVDVTERIVGKLCALEGDTIVATLSPSDNSDEADEARPAPPPRPPSQAAGPDATAAFLAAHAPEAFQ